MANAQGRRRGGEWTSPGAAMHSAEQRRTLTEPSSPRALIWRIKARRGAAQKARSSYFSRRKHSATRLQAFRTATHSKDARPPHRLLLRLPGPRCSCGRHPQPRQGQALGCAHHSRSSHYDCHGVLSISKVTRIRKRHTSSRNLTYLGGGMDKEKYAYKEAYRRQH